MFLYSIFSLICRYIPLEVVVVYSGTFEHQNFGNFEFANNRQKTVNPSIYIYFVTNKANSCNLYSVI